MQNDIIVRQPPQPQAEDQQVAMQAEPVSIAEPVEIQHEATLVPEQLKHSSTLPVGIIIAAIVICTLLVVAAVYAGLSATPDSSLGL